ncbi:cytochrome c3 family protein [Sulfurimonas sp.]
MKRIGIIKKIAFMLFLFIGSAAYSAGPHDGVSCLGCHSTHFAIDDKLFAVKNKKMINPRNGASLEGLVARNCLGCHELEQFGGAGIRPVHLHTTHPIGIKPNPKIADVPDNLLKDGKLDCISCHEPHPSNKNFMYLRVKTDQGGSIQNFCVTCHSVKGDLTAMGIKDAKDIKVFSAMDQEKGAKSFLRNEVNIHNKTPSYIVPLGKNNPNDLVPNYQNQPDWVYSPEIDPLKNSKTEEKPKKED